MKSIVFMVICCLFSAPIGMEGACCGFVVPLITRPTTKLITDTRFLDPIVHAPRIPTSCPNQFTYNSAFRKCYYLVNTKNDFDSGNSTCVSSGGSLVMPRTNDELRFLAQMIPYPDYNEAYIGVTYRTINGTAEFYYLDGTPYTICRRVMTTPYSANSVMAVQKLTLCSTNWPVSHIIYSICEAAPFY